MIRHKYLTIFFIFVIICSWFLVFRYNTLTSPFSSDEGEYAYSAQLLRDGGIPYTEAFMQKPPMIIYTYLAGNQLLSRNTYAPRIIALIFLTLTTVVMMFTVKKRYGVREAIVYGIIFPPLVSLPFFGGLDAQPEVFLLLPLSGIIWSYTSWQADQKNKQLLLLGFCSAVSFFFKPIILPALCFVYASILFAKTNPDDSLPRRTDRLVFVFLGFLAASFFIILPIYLRGGLTDMWLDAFVYNFYYSSLFGMQLAVLFGILKTIWPLFLFFIWFVYKRPTSWLFFCGLFFSLLLGTGAGGMEHYYIIVLPILALIAAIGIVNLSRIVKNECQNPLENSVTLFVFSLLIVSFLWLPRIEWFTMNPDETIVARYDMFPLRESVMIAEKIKEIASPDDRILVYGVHPEILYYAERKSATRFVITYPLSFDTPFREQFEKEMEDDVTKNKPKIIVTEGLPPSDKTLNRPGALSKSASFVATLLKSRYQFAGAVTLDKFPSSDLDLKFAFHSNIENIGEKHIQFAMFVLKD